MTQDIIYGTYRGFDYVLRKTVSTKGPDYIEHYHVDVPELKITVDHSDTTSLSSLVQRAITIIEDKCNDRNNLS